eukprot:5394896-Amphidinium_carterae.1
METGPQARFLEHACQIRSARMLKSTTKYAILSLDTQISMIPQHPNTSDGVSCAFVQSCVTLCHVLRVLATLQGIHDLVLDVFDTWILPDTSAPKDSMSS